MDKLETTGEAPVDDTVSIDDYRTVLAELKQITADRDRHKMEHLRLLDLNGELREELCDAREEITRLSLESSRFLRLSRRLTEAVKLMADVCAMGLDNEDDGAAEGGECDD